MSIPESAVGKFVWFLGGIRASYFPVTHSKNCNNAT